MIAIIQNERLVLQAPWKVLWSQLRIAWHAPLGNRTGHAQSGVEDVGTNFRPISGTNGLRIKVIADEELEQILSQSNSIPRILSQYILANALWSIRFFDLYPF